MTAIELGGFSMVRIKWLLDALESGRREVSDKDTFEGGVLSVGGEHIGWKGEWFLENPRYVSREFFDAMKAGVIEKEDILLVKDGATIGKVAIADKYPGQDAAVNEHVFLLRLNSQSDNKFYFYVLQSLIFQEQIQVEITGAAQPGLNTEFRNVVVVPEPPKSTQFVIAEYLDRETAHIDSLIAEKERMLALLEEKRTALISQTVTRGLEPDVPLKPSGLDWLGDIPAHWNLVRIKYLITELTQGSSPQASNTPAEPDEDGVLKLSAVSKGRFVRGENKALRESDGSSQLLSLRKGDVLITRGNTPALVADACFVPQDEPNLLIPDLIYRLRVNQEKVLPELLSNFLVTKEARTQIRRDARGSSGSMVKVSQEHVAGWFVPIPPTIAEQEKIVDGLARTELQLRSLSVELQESVRLLIERRSALITAAVTGQIDPKDMAA